MLKQLQAFWKDEEGVTAIEYALIAALIAVAMIGTLTTLGGTVGSAWTAISNAILAAI